MTDPSPLCEAALDYAGIGWPIFPCRPKGKEPIGAAVPHGVKDATTDPDRIRRWWHRWPNANIAVACGAPGPDVLDVDTKDGRSGQDLYRRAWRLGLLRGHTAAIATPSGGRHFWFAGTDQRGAAVGKDKALELKAVGGYVLLPPSYVESADYGYAGHYEVVEHADREAVIDFAAVKRHLDPPPAPVRIGRRNIDHSSAPGTAFNNAADWTDILMPRGWPYAGQRGRTGYWRRPGKQEGISATTNALGTDRLHVFTTSVPELEPGSYSKFGFITTVDFGGDFVAAARHLRAFGYGGAPQRAAA
jgi:hypothetical protein